VNQKGGVKAIGGVNEKIEGFFEVCKAKGLTGKQGVMIPQSNVEDLMLREDVLDAVASGKFHVWPVAKVEQGIEILTGNLAGEKDGNGKFGVETVFALVDDRLRDMAKTLKEFE
jgi:predicted ATP-dependent protease